MGPSIAALIVISVLLTAVVVMFRANQIGATLLANATKANAERVTEIGNTKFEITSVSTSTDWYSQAEAVDPPNTFGCKPILYGIKREGEIKATDPYQCYWFDGEDGDVVDIQVSRLFQGTNFGDRLRTGNVISLDLFIPGEDPRGTTYGFAWLDMNWPTDDHVKTITLNQSGKYRFKLWRASQPDFSTGDHGIYYVKVNIGNKISSNQSSCVSNFRIVNQGSAVFSDFENMDVIANLDSNTTTFLTRSGDLLPGLNEWSVSIPATTTIDGIVKNNDVFQQGILNTGEIMELRVNLSGYSDESGTIVVVFPNGVRSTKKFDLLCNN